MPHVAGAQEVVVSTSGGLGEAETAGVVINVIPRDGGNTFSGRFFARRERRDAGQQLHAGAEGPGPDGAAELVKVYDFNPHGRRPDRPGQAVVLHDVPRRGRQHGSGHVFNKNAGNPNAWTVDLD